MAGATIRAQVKLEGGRAFEQDFNKSAAAIKSANTQIKYFSNEIDRNGKSQNSLVSKMTALKSAYDAEGQAIERIKARLEEVKNMEGDNEVAISGLTTELYKHKDAQDQLQSEMDQTEEELEQFKRGADDTSDKVEELGDDSETAGSKIGDAFAQEVARATVGLQVMWDVGKKAAKFLWDIGKDAVMYNAEMESYSKTIEAFFKTSGQTAEEAAENTATLIQNQKELSTQVGIGTDKLIDANKMLIASGVSGNNSQRAISALAKAIVATGGGNEELSRMAQNLQQISNTGKASTQDMKQFAMAGVDVYGLLAESTGKSVEQLKEMDITFDMIVEALDLATQEGGKFFEASQVGATTLNGQLSTLESTVKDKLGVAFQPFNDALQNDILPQVMELVEEIDWNALGEMMADAAKVATEAFGVLANTLSTLAETYGIVKDAVDDWGNVEERVTTDVANGYIGTAGAFKKAYDEHQRFTSGTQKGLNTIKNKATDVNKTIAGMPTAWTSAIPLAQNVGNQLANGVSQPLKDLSGQSSSWGVHMVQGLIGGIDSMVPSVGTAAARAANAIRQVLEFTRPDKGPLHNYEEWMPHMMQGLAKGIDDNLWLIQDASKQVASTLAAPQYVANYNGGINMTVNAAQGQNANEIADEVMNRIQRATQRRVAVWA